MLKVVLSNSRICRDETLAGINANVLTHKYAINILYRKMPSVFVLSKVSMLVQIAV